MSRLNDISRKLEQVFEPRQATVLAEAITEAYTDWVKTSDFNELKGVVRDLAEAQKRTENRVEELAEAQKRTEIRLEELAEAQKRTEKRVEELALAQTATERAVAALTERVDQLTQSVNVLANRLDDTNRQLGGLSATVGYSLENQSYKALPTRLKNDFDITLSESLRRTYLKDAHGVDIEVNIVGRGERAGQALWVIGESKIQLSKNDVDRFLHRRVAALEPVLGEIFPLMVAHMISQPDALAYAQSKGVAVYLSYQFDH